MSVLADAKRMSTGQPAQAVSFVDWCCIALSCSNQLSGAGIVPKLRAVELRLEHIICAISTLSMYPRALASGCEHPSPHRRVHGSRA